MTTSEELRTLAKNRPYPFENMTARQALKLLDVVDAAEKWRDANDHGYAAQEKADGRLMDAVDAFRGERHEL